MSGRWARSPRPPITQWISIVATAVDRTLIRQYVVAHVFPETADGLPDRAAIEAVLPELRDVFTLLEARLSGGEYLAANRFTFADALLLTTLNAALSFPEAAEIATDAPAVRRYVDLHSRRWSFVDTTPGS
jgi:glutathione S-transferase